MDPPSPEGTAGSSPDQDSASAGAANKRLRIVTRCAVLEEFLATFGGFADESSVFIVTNKPRPLGLRQPFVIQLKDGETIMRGDVEVIASITDGTGPDGRNGMRLRLLDADDATREVHRRLLDHAQSARKAGSPTDQDRAPESVGVASEARPELGAHQPPPKPPAPAVAPPGLATISSSAPSTMAPPPAPRPGRPPPPPRPAAGAPATATPAPGAAASPAATPPPRPGSAPSTMAPPPVPPPSAPSTMAPPAGPAASSASAASAPSVAPPPGDERAPGASYQLPANPFESVTAEALESFVECTLYEERVPRPEDDIPPPSRSGAQLSTAPPALLAVPPVAPLGIPPPPPPAGAPITMSPPAPTFGVPPAPTFGASPAPTFGAAPPPPSPTVSEAVALAAAIQAASAPTRPERRPWFAGLAVTAVVSSVGSLVAAYMLWGPGSSSTPPPVSSTGAGASAAATVPVATAPVASTPVSTTTAAPPSTSAAPRAEPTPPAAQHPCRANVRSYPEGASVSWNGESLGITPLADAPVPCGPAKITFDLRGYAPGERSATAVIGKAAGVFLRLAPQRVLLEVTSTPPGAQLLVDARSMGRTPAKASLMGLRESTIVVTMPGYKPWTTKLTPEPPKVSLHADLEKR